MTKFRHKGNISDEGFIIHVLNNLPKEYDVILDEFENCLMATGENALIIDSIHAKLIHRYEKFKSKKEKKNEKESVK